MADKSNPFAYAHYQKAALNKTTAYRVQIAYSTVHSNLQKKLDALKMINPSDNMRKVYLENFMREAKAAYDEMGTQLKILYATSAEKAGQIAVEAGNTTMKQVGLSIKGAYAYIPKREVENIISGSLYGKGWSLSQAIWKTGKKTTEDIQKMVAKGLAENKSIKDIADDLTKYVDPTARKPWDWSKVYPGTAAQVDYNAQRLARTMIQHSFQSSLVQSQLYNPFCKGIIWHSEGIHGRTCELCMERDGQVFPLKDLPLDHPNGLCYFEPALEDMDKIADRMSDWVVGEPDPEIEKYITKGLGINGIGTKAARQAVRSVKQSTTAQSIAKPVAQTKTLPKRDKFRMPTEDRKTSNAWVKERAEKQAYTSKQLSAFDEYMMDSDSINGWLRGEVDYWNKKVSDVLSKSMTTYTSEDAVYRGIDGRLLGLTGDETAEEAAKKLVGRTRVEKGFMSSTRSQDVAEEFSKRAAYDEMETKSNVVLVLQVKGKKVAYLQSGLSEVLIDKGSKMTFTDVVKKKGKLYVYAVVK